MKTGNAWFATYAYDANGNRLTMTQNGVTTAYTYDANNRLTEETVAGVAKTYTYDANGNLINAWNGGNPIGAYSYNLFGNQTSFTSDGIVYTNYTYRSDGLRHSIGDKVHIWDGANIVADVDGNDVVVYIRGVNLIYADDGYQTYYHFNAHGDVVVLTNESGNKTKSYSYNAFGVEYNEATLDDNPFRYCGEYYDKETQTIYLRARYYNAVQGRFTQEDPIRDGYNWYSYCGGNPVNFIDPTGKSMEDFIAGLVFSLDDGIFAGLAQSLAETLADDYLDYTPEDEVDYYTGRVLGDLLSMATGIMDIYYGLQMIHSALTNGVSIIVASEGTLVVQGVAIAVAGTAAGAAVVTYGTTKVVAAGNNLSSDIVSLSEAHKKETNGRAKNKLAPDPNAQGEHTAFKRDPVTGKITNYATYKSNPRNPHGYDLVIAYDGVGTPHHNKVTGEDLMPHVHDKKAPGGVRKPFSFEIPK